LFVVPGVYMLIGADHSANADEAAGVGESA
jgi:hypothetical protein